MKRIVLLFMAAVAAMPAQQIPSAPVPALPVVTVDNPPNSPAQQAKHYVILVSLDGFRYDYPTKYGAPHLLAMAKDGASAPDGMSPSYPSLTFPNHISIVTGLYPEHHGIVANSFFDPARNDTYVYTQSETNGDGSWYGGTPLWVLAEQQGMRAACFFWPGSEAEIQGKRPSYYLHYDDKLDDAKRVEQVLAWLALPPEQRPHFITLYFSNVDHAGHSYGPESDEVRAAVHHVDEMIGNLQAGIAALKLPVDLVVVADHGMVTLKGDAIDLSTFADLSDVHTEGSLIYAKDEAQAAKIYAEFKAHHDPRFGVFRRAQMPQHLDFDSNPREGDPVIVPYGPYTFRTKPAAAFAGGGTLRGGHGFDPMIMPEMKAIFFADGPDIKPGALLTPFPNVDVYPFIAQLLELTTPAEDGSAKLLVDALKKYRPKLNPAIKKPDKSQPIHENMVWPKFLKQVDPQFTPEAREARFSGNVAIRFTVEPDGRPSHATIFRGAGYGLNQKAIEALSQDRFAPATLDGVPIPMQIDVLMTFAIH